MLDVDTLNNVHATLQACEPPIRQIFAIVFNGWRDAGGAVQCSRPGRIYLRLTAPEQSGGTGGLRSHAFNLAVLTAAEGKRGPAVEVAWNPADNPAHLDYTSEAVANYRAGIMALPGYSQDGVVHRLILGKAFHEEHADRLLAALLSIKTAQA